MVSPGGPTIRFRFNPEKATQAAARLLQLAGGRLNYMKLLKLLYLADRGALGKWGAPITGDRFVAMPHGPVLSKIYSQIASGPDPQEGDEPWFKLIAKDQYDVFLRADPPRDELSDREIQLLDATFDEFREMDQWQLRDYCHAELPEWSDPNGSSITIPYESVLAALGKTEDQVKEIAAESAFMDFARDTLGQV